ncbi:MAG TPA: sigma-70 family RNA polymerase sigma factor [bacterium]|nr:sigma-70 family RNA polymerase sigma factor [bacterium]
MDFNDGQWRAWSDLMKRTQAGDGESYGRLLAEISPLVLNFVRKRVYDRQQVEDVAQEVLLTFHKAKHTYRAELPFGPWFFTVIRNAVWSALQKNRRLAGAELLMGDFPEAAAPEAGEDQMDDRLLRALEGLPDIYRQAVDLLKFKGMSVEQAAAQLGVSQVALRVRAHRGYALLRKKLKAPQGKKND